MNTLELTDGQLDYISDGVADSLKEYFEDIHEAYPGCQPPPEIRAELMEKIDLAKMLDIIPYAGDREWIDIIL